MRYQNNVQQKPTKDNEKLFVNLSTLNQAFQNIEHKYARYEEKMRTI